MMGRCVCEWRSIYIQYSTAESKRRVERQALDLSQISVSRLSLQTVGDRSITGRIKDKSLSLGWRSRATCHILVFRPLFFVIRKMYEEKYYISGFYDKYVDFVRSSCNWGGQDHSFHINFKIEQPIRNNIFVPRVVAVGQEPTTFKLKLNTAHVGPW